MSTWAVAFIAVVCVTSVAQALLFPVLRFFRVQAVAGDPAGKSLEPAPVGKDLDRDRLGLLCW
jgi:hypothetical protein